MYRQEGSVYSVSEQVHALLSSMFWRRLFRALSYVNGVDTSGVCRVLLNGSNSC